MNVSITGMPPIAGGDVIVTNTPRAGETLEDIAARYNRGVPLPMKYPKEEASARQQLIARVEQLHAKSLDIMRAKNADYANTDDPFSNFEAVEAFGISTAEGFITRMVDKLRRISNLISREAAVKDESIEDTLLDLANYALLFRVYLEQKKVKEPAF